MIDLFTRAELRILAGELEASASNTLCTAGLIEDARKRYAQEIGNTAMHAVAATMSELLPYVDEDTAKYARCSIWASESDGVGRAGLVDTAADRLKRLIHAPDNGDADAALGILERYLFALFVATRRLRKLPAACRIEHVCIVDKLGPICKRCGERPEQ